MATSITKKTGKTYRIKTGADAWDEVSFQTNQMDLVDGDGDSVLGEEVSKANMGSVNATTLVPAIKELNTTTLGLVDWKNNLGNMLTWVASFNSEDGTLDLYTDASKKPS